MDFNYGKSRLRSNAHVIRSLVQGIPEDQARWKPDAGTWSILEVICHLMDEEEYDFRVRLDYLLHKPGEMAPGIDPEGWVTERAYNEQTLQDVLENFLLKRESSLKWLDGLTAPDWSMTLQMPYGPITAGDMFASWVAHDFIHIRQLVRLHWVFMQRKVGPYRTDYAGSW